MRKRHERKAVDYGGGSPWELKIREGKMKYHFIVGLLSLGLLLAGCNNATRKSTEMETPEKKIEELMKQAEEGDAGAQFSLGVMYYEGEGVPKDESRAFEWFQKAAAQGYSNAQFNLGWMYAKGEGVSKDATKAVEWYQKAAAQGQTDAQFNLGVMYAKGEGVPKDATKAVEWYQKAAAQGQARAQLSLGRMYFLGTGVPKDKVLAYAWTNLSAVGEPGMVKPRDILEKLLTTSERAEAQSLSSRWKIGEVLNREGR